MTAVGYLWPLGSYNPIRAALGETLTEWRAINGAPSVVKL